MVFGVDDDRLGQVPVAVVQLEPGASRDDADAIAASVRAELAPYEVPTAVAVVDALPRTPSHKVDLAATREWFASRSRGAGG